MHANTMRLSQYYQSKLLIIQGKDGKDGRDYTSLQILNDVIAQNVKQGECMCVGGIKLLESNKQWQMFGKNALMCKLCQ